MKKLLLASAVAALSVSAAQAAPTVYGKAFLTLDMNTGDTDTTVTSQTYANGNVVASSSNTKNVDADDRSKLNSNASRIGFKGSEPLMAGTDLVYQLEYGIRVDEDRTQFTSRDTYMGLSNKQMGTLVAGRLTAIDGKVDYANVASGGVLGGDGVLASFDAPRANNSLAYFSPNYNGMQFMAMYVMDENTSRDSLGRDAFGLGVKSENGPLNAGASYIQAGDFKAARVSGSYDLNSAMTVGALYQMTDYDTQDNENAITVSGTMKTATPWTAYAQGDVVTNVGGASDADAFRVVVGGKYAFNKATTGHIYGAYLNSEETDKSGTLVAGNGTLTTVKEETNGFGIGGGIEYKF